MSDFPIELFNLLLSPQVSPQLRVEYIALGKLGVLPVDYVSSKLEKSRQLTQLTSVAYRVPSTSAFP